MPTNLAEYYRGVEAAAAAAGDAVGAERAHAVWAAVAPLLDASPGDPPRVCGRGCAHCCHLPVGISFAEAAALAASLRGRREPIDRILAAARETAALDWNELVGRPCPLLDGGACDAYDARPLPCRALASRDADACRAALTGGTEPPYDTTAYWRGLGAAAALAHGEPAGRRELRAAVAALLADPADPCRAFTSARPAADGR